MKLVGLNSFMRKKHKAAKEYLLNLIDVKDADQHLQVNRYNKMTGTSVPSIIIGTKEIAMLHKLMDEHKDEVIQHNEDGKDPLIKILDELGNVPEIEEDDNKEVQLELVNKFEVEIKEGEEEKDFKKRTLEEALKILENISIPPGKNFMEILVRAKLFAEKDGKDDIADSISALIKNLKRLEEKGLIIKGDGFSSFLKELFEEVNDMKIRIEEQKKEIERLKKALAEIEDQKTYMDNKIEAFEAYLASLRRDAEERFKEKSKKFSYKELVKKNVIAETDIEEGLLKKIVFNIKQVAVDKFEIKGRIKTGPVSLAESIKLELEELLVAKESQQPTFDIGSGLVLNVKPTLMIINKYFFSQ